MGVKKVNSTLLIEISLWFHKRAVTRNLSPGVILHVAYFWALAGAYRWGDLSFAYPVMRGGAPVLVALASVAAFGEALSWTQAAAVALICGGILAFASGPRGDAPRAIIAASRSCCFAFSTS